MARDRKGSQLQLGAIKTTKRRERLESLPAVKVSEMSDSGGQLRMEIIGAKHLQEPSASPDRVIPAEVAECAPHGRAMLNQAQQQLANLEALKTLEGVVGEMYGE